MGLGRSEEFLVPLEKTNSLDRFLQIASLRRLFHALQQNVQYAKCLRPPREPLREWTDKSLDLTLFGEREAVRVDGAEALHDTREAQRLELVEDVPLAI